MTVIAEAPQMRGKPNTDGYPPGMAKRVLLSVQEVRRMIGKLSEAMKAAEHIVLTTRSKPFAVIVPIEWYREAAKKMKDPTEY